MDDEMTIGQKILAILGIILCIIAIIGVFILYYYTSPDYVAGWNDGVCKYCDTEWVYVDAVGHRNWTSYIYVCPSCGSMLRINSKNEEEILPLIQIGE